MQTRFSIISNKILKYFLIFAISFLWLNFYNNNLLQILLISIIIALILGYIISLLSKRRKKIINLSNKEHEKMKEVSFKLLMASRKDMLTFFNILLKINHSTTQLKTKDVIICEDFAFIPFYKKRELTEDDLIEIYKNNKYNKIIISCVTFSNDTLLLSQKIASSKIYLINESELFTVLKKYDLYPDFNIPTNTKKKFKYRDLKDIAFTKKNAKHYLFSGFIILITSIFIKYNIYYLIFATILFVLSGISFFKPQQRQSEIIDEI